MDLMAQRSDLENILVAYEPERFDVPNRDLWIEVKYFDPCGRSTFYVVARGEESEGILHSLSNDFILYGFVVGPFDEECDEFGPFSLNELDDVTGPLGIGIERDLHFTPNYLGNIIPKHSKVGQHRERSEVVVIG